HRLTRACNQTEVDQHARQAGAPGERPPAHQLALADEAVRGLLRAAGPPELSLRASAWRTRRGGVRRPAPGHLRESSLVVGSADRPGGVAALVCGSYSLRSD